MKYHCEYKKAAESLYSLFSRLQAIEDQQLQSVEQLFEDGMLTKLVFNFTTVSLFVEAETDYDTVSFSVHNISDVHKIGFTDISNNSFFDKYINKPFGWGWLTINQQGYCDGMLISFNDIRPQIAINIVASEINIYSLDEKIINTSMGNRSAE